MNRYRVFSKNDDEFWVIVRISDNKIVHCGYDYQIMVDTLNMLNDRELYKRRSDSYHSAKRIIEEENK